MAGAGVRANGHKNVFYYWESPAPGSRRVASEEAVE